MSHFTKQILEEIRKDLVDWQPKVEVSNTGVITEIKDGIVKIDGLSECLMSEKLEFSDGSYGIALNLEERSVGAIVTSKAHNLKVGDIVKSTGDIIKVPVGLPLLGRVVNALGASLDGCESLENHSDIKHYPVERIAPGVITRTSVHRPLHTGIIAIDALIPIGRGQRELIIGDRQTGKTALVIDTILNQKGVDIAEFLKSKNKKNVDDHKTEQPVVCVYVAIGQKDSKVAKIISTLERYGAMKYTVIVNASASDPATMQYIAPYTGTAIGEYFMHLGMDSLVIYDDLSKHANAYRQISLLLKRPAGREAYPGDIFYLHSRLLERAAQMNTENGGGSLTALPIIETQLGDVSAYIPTNVISITDGQIYLDTDIFRSGMRPAIDIGLSVSRVGSAAQISAMKSVAGRLRLDLAQFRELATFAQFSSDLSQNTLDKINQGKRLTEILKQKIYKPRSIYHQVLMILACTNGLFNKVKIDDIQNTASDLISVLDDKYADNINELRKTNKLSKPLEAKLLDNMRDILKS